MYAIPELLVGRFKKMNATKRKASTQMTIRVQPKMSRTRPVLSKTSRGTIGERCISGDRVTAEQSKYLVKETFASKGIEVK